MRMRHTVICGVPGGTIFFPHYITNGMICPTPLPNKKKQKKLGNAPKKKKKREKTKGERKNKIFETFFFPPPPPKKKKPSAMMTLVLLSKIKNKEQEHVCSFPYIFPSPEHTPV